jgi:hypothetical protein
VFQDRKKAGNDAEALVAKYLKQVGRPWRKLSPESYLPRNITDDLASVIQHLQRSEDVTHQRWAQSLKAFRYAPDFQWVDDDGTQCFVDAKASKFVERQCYEEYTRLEAAGNRVYLAIVLEPNTIQLIRVSALRFTDIGWMPRNGGSGLPCKEVYLWGNEVKQIQVVDKDVRTTA